jgi:hypothetical protein
MLFILLLLLKDPRPACGGPGVFELKPGFTDGEVRRMYARAVVLQGPRGDLLEREAYGVYVANLDLGRHAAYQRGLDHIQAYVFKMFDVVVVRK